MPFCHQAFSCSVFNPVYSTNRHFPPLFGNRKNGQKTGHLTTVEENSQLC